jgi:DNA polymerase I
MKCRFYLLDVNEDEWRGRPCVRLWGVDERGKRILILINQIMPYFYFLFEEKENLEPIRQMLLRDKKRFPKILSVTVETKKLLGHDRQVLKITCAESDVRLSYSKELQKVLGKGESFEHDLRLSVRYITDLMLTPCGWNECDADSVIVNGVAVDSAYLATQVPRTVTEDRLPNLRMLAFHALTAGEKGSAKPERDPIRGITVVTDSGKTETFVLEGKDDSKLLKDFVEFVKGFDPDVIVGFESNRLDWPYLIQRSKVHKFKMSVGRDSSEPHTSVYGHVSVTGRANLDLLDVAGGISEVKVKTLENVAKFLQLPSVGKFTTIEEWDRYELWTDETGKRKLIQNAMMMAQALLELAQATINFPMQLSALTGLPLDQVMTAAVGFRVDSYLVRQAHRIGELIPTKNEQPFFTYRGATVLEPKTGLHDDVAVLDFASMYPSLMRNYNLSPDTLVRPEERVPEDSVFVIPELKHRFRKKPDGFYRTVLSTLIDERSNIKQELEKIRSGSTRFKVLQERERALKVITNACYGYAGWAGARWYVREVAESATALGRETIMKTIAKAESIRLDIIYGDTDSIFVKNDTSKIKQLLNWVKKELKLEIKIEREYVRILFTEAMKRYAGLLSDGSLDIVGLEVVRGDWSDIARQVQEQVLENILRDQSPEKAVETARTTIRKLQNGEVPIADLTIRKTLTKPIESYAVRTPHVEVAKKLMKEGWDLTLGDKVAYVITKGPGKRFEKARPYSQVKPGDVDVDYYLENQVKPAAMRILERFGVSEEQLAA